MEKSTSDLLSVLKSKKNYSEFFQNEIGELIFKSLDEYLGVLLKEKNLKKSEVIEKSNLDKNYAYQLFNGIKTEHTPVMVERIVGDIDNIVRLVRFDGWQNTATGQKEVQRALRKIVWQKYSIKDPDIFEKAYKYIEEYY